MTPTLADATFWVAVVACAIAQLAIVRSVLVARAPERPAGAPALPVRRPVEVAWAIVPALALAGVLALTWRALHPAADPTPGAPPAAVLESTP